MRRTNIYLDERQTERLDRLAAEEGISRAGLIRRLIDRTLGGATDADLAADLDAINASFGAARSLDVVARESDGRDRHLAATWQLNQ